MLGVGGDTLVVYGCVWRHSILFIVRGAWRHFRYLVLGVRGDTVCLTVGRVWRHSLFIVMGVWRHSLFVFLG